MIRPEISPLAEASERSAEALLHELQAYVADLETQNRTLHETCTILQESRDRYFELYESAPVSYLTLSEKGLIADINLSGAAMLGMERGKLLKYRFARFIAPRHSKLWQAHFLSVLEGTDKLNCELALQRSDGSLLHVRLDSQRLVKDGSFCIRTVLTDCTERKQVEAALQKSEALNQAILDSVTSEIAVLDHDGKIIAINRPWQRFALENSVDLGKTMPTIRIGANYLAACPADTGAAAHEALNARNGIQAVLDGRLPSFSLEYPCHSPEQQRWFCMSVTPLGDGVVITHTNITEHKQAVESVRIREEFFRMIAENVEEFIAVLDLQGQRLYNSPSYARFFADVESMKGTNSFSDVHPEDLERVERTFRETVHSGRSHHLIYRLVLANGSIRHMESCGVLIRNSQGQATHVVVVSRDISERIESEKEILSLAFYDTLTQLPNRRLLNDRLNQAMAASMRSGSYGALMLLDLDNFKMLNDIYGHMVGDLLLIEVARRLTSCVREMDTVARFGGDEFVVLLSMLDEDKTDAVMRSRLVAEKIRAVLAVPYVLKFQSKDGMETTVGHHCTSSIGIALFINRESGIEDLLRHADMAMYQAKQAGRNSLRFYDLET